MNLDTPVVSNLDTTLFARSHKMPRILTSEYPSAHLAVLQLRSGRSLVSGLAGGNFRGE